MRVAQRPCQPWFCCEIAEVKNSRRRLECKWRQTGLEADRFIFVEARNNVSKLISAAKTSFYSRRIEKFSGNQKALFREMNHLLNKKTVIPLPPHETPLALANQFAAFFQTKLTKFEANRTAVFPSLRLHQIRILRLKQSLSNYHHLSVCLLRWYLTSFRPVHQKHAISTPFLLGY